jgi:DNA repair ATPase RecN
MPLDDLNIGVKDLHRKLLALKAIHQQNLLAHPEYLTDVIDTYLCDPEIEQKYKFQYKEFKGHPDDNGYLAIGDYFSQKIGITG